jgi:hypothetical protein
MVIFTFLVIIAVNHRLSMGHLPVTSNTWFVFIVLSSIWKKN